uniref:Transcription initiation factor TFIID subunit 8 n=1 Tax=Salmo trutta TaxID=8032 RepID=A0A674BDW1_SALTR
MADPAVMAGGFSAVVGRSGGGKATSSPAENYQLARRRTLQVVVSSLLTECGFESAEKAAVESLTEMIQSCILTSGKMLKNYSLKMKSLFNLPSSTVSCITTGFNVNTLPVYAKRSQRMVITAPPVTNAPVIPKALIAGQKRTHPSHIPSHFPEFPDPHTYIKTPTFREPVSDYQVVREKAASQRRDVERALTRFMAKTGETQTLVVVVTRDSNSVILIAARPSSIPYLSALLPSELELQTLEETDSSEQDDQTDSENTPGNNLNDDPGADKENSMLPPGGVVPSVKASEENMIDNPYLRPVKKPKVRRKK